MNLLKLLNLRGIKRGILILSIAFNIAWVVLFFNGIDWLIARSGSAMTGLDTTIMLGIFLGSSLIGFGICWLAKDGRGRTYGIYGGLAGLIGVALILRSSPLLAALAGLIAVLGGFNGATLAEAILRTKK